MDYKQMEDCNKKFNLSLITNATQNFLLVRVGLKSRVVFFSHLVGKLDIFK